MNNKNEHINQSFEASQPHNVLKLTARLVGKSVLRFTPAGVPVSEFQLEHESEQQEASKPRQVRCVVNAVAMGVLASQIDSLYLGCVQNWSGFIALRSYKSKSLQFHVCALHAVQDS